jgi:two-component system response regulator MprA
MRSPQVSPSQSSAKVAESARILVADDDRAIRESLERVLGLEGYQVVTVADGAAALESARSVPVDLMVLDLMMPSVDGLTVCRVLRSEKDRTPILMLTARTETSDRVAGLDAGADDYLAKPFDPAELMARVRALLRRALPQDAEQKGIPSSEHGRGTGTGDGKGSTTLIVEDLRLDSAARRCWRGENELELSKTEFDLLELLMFNTGIVLSRSHIYEEIWDYDFGPDSKNLAVYISYLRRKVDDGQAVPLIQTVRGVGYTLRRP